MKEWRSPGVINFVLAILDKQGGIAILAFLVLIGMMTGILPMAGHADLDSKMEAISVQHTTMMEGQTRLENKVDEAVRSAAQNGDLQTKLLRGICLLQTSNQKDQLTYCNP